MKTTNGTEYNIGDIVKLSFPNTNPDGTEYYINGELTKMTKKFCDIKITYCSRKNQYENIGKWNYEVRFMNKFIVEKLQ